MQSLGQSAKCVGFTQKQREWIIKRDNNRCLFRQKIDGEWVQCVKVDELQVHHIIPKTWAFKNIPRGFEINGPNNGISLCRFHHIGYNAGLDEIDMVVHPDVEKARLSYVSRNKNAYKEMKRRRKELIEFGLPYWNTEYDWYFTLMAKERTKRFKENYPEHRKYGLIGF